MVILFIQIHSLTHSNNRLLSLTHTQYGKAMSEPLPYGGVRFLSPSEAAPIERQFMNHGGRDLPSDGPIGWFLEVDLRIPESMHSYFSEFPPLPVKRQITNDEYSPHTSELAHAYQLKTASNAVKLITDVGDKLHYKLHYVYLKNVLALGVQLMKVHRVIAFKQKPWLQPFIHHNNEKRKLSTSTFESQFWKLCNNACFGKLLQNTR